MNDYLENVREIERRIQKSEQNGSQEETLDLPEAPAGIPYNFEQHINLMYDLLALAYQTNVTRVATFMVAREVSNRTYPQIGVPDGHHATSHHQNKPEKIEKLVKIQHYHLTLFAKFPGEVAVHQGRRRHAARSLDSAVRQQHEQQQRA